MDSFVYTVIFIILIYIPIFYRLHSTIRKLEERIIELESQWANRNVVPLHKKK